MIVLFYGAFLGVFFLPLLLDFYQSKGFKTSVKELDGLEPTGKKEMQQYHIDNENREHMIEEVEHMRINDGLDFYIATIILGCFTAILFKKAKLFIKKRHEIAKANKFIFKWQQLKVQNIETLTEDTCRICLIEFADNDKVIQLKCNVNHVYHKTCFN